MKIKRGTEAKRPRKGSGVVHVEGHLVWKWSRTSSGNYVAFCDSIAQSVQASTFGELFETINEALGSTFNELFSSGDLAAFLQEHGWKSVDLPMDDGKKDVRFDMPFDLKGVSNCDLEEAIC